MISFITLNTLTKHSSFRPAMQRGTSDAQQSISQQRTYESSEGGSSPHAILVKHLDLKKRDQIKWRTMM